MNEDSATKSQNQNAMSVLRRFVRPRAVAERCDLCSAELADDHQHLLDPASRQLLCSCDECAISIGDRSGAKYKRVPRRGRFLQGFHISDADWDALMIPVGMAFFFYTSSEDRVMAYYPSPAGPTESLLPLESWQEVVRANPILEQMEPDVEALLVNRLRNTRDYYLAPIDKCYELVGLIRTNWKGLSGGTEVWAEINRFYARLKEQSAQVAHAPEVATQSGDVPLA